MSSGSGNAMSTRKKIGIASCLLIGVAMVSPLAPVTVFGPVQQLTGGHMSLAFLIALIPMIFVAYVYGIFAAEFPRAGGGYTFVSKGLHPYLGFITGWVLLIDYCLVPLMSFLMVSIYFCSIFPAVNPYIIRVICLALGFVINLRTIKGVAGVNNVITAVVAGIMIYFIIAGISVLSGGSAGVTFTSQAFYNPDTFSWSTIFSGAATACFAFLGFDALTTLAEDVNKPRRTLPKAMILICIIAAAFYIVSAYVAQCLYPNFNAYSSVDSAMLDPMFMAGGNVLMTMVSIGMIVAMFSVMVDVIAASSRLLYAMGREGAIPKKPFGYENPKNHVPTYNVIILVAIFAALIWADVNVIITMITFGGLLAYVLVNLAAIRYFFFVKKDRKGIKVFAHFIVPLIGFLTCGYLWLSLGAAAQIFGFIWLAAGIIYLAIRTKGFRKPIAKFADEVDVELAEQESAEDKTDNTNIAAAEVAVK